MKIDELIKKDKTFTEANLLAKVDNIFIMLLSSIMVGNLDRVKHKLSNSLFNEYNLFLNRLKENNEIQIFDELNVKSSEIIDIEEDTDKYVVKIRLVARYMKYKINSNTRKYKSGNDTSRVEEKYILVMTKSKNAVDEDIIKVCPGCGASIDVNNSGICSYCGTVYNTKDYDWILEKIIEDID
ncbi:MAG: TIM44-like domain-containing protein [Mollicutes bacterium]|nr:TIM44-like domain-containing protein [Mollicutes bacterium]MDY5875951.1 TIM44-like domain-containing protein [Bacilli bacterium]